ncbi:MAG: M28 family peptidase [Verrucomicrobiota bacterium]|nr:M28 family peptidase [Verrucomicrobiota bacterium]
MSRFKVTPSTPVTFRKQLRQWLIRGLRVSAIIGCVIAGAWVFLAQPIMAGDNPPTPVTVNPARLEAHVRMLSETLAPRSYRHAENLDKVASYIAEQFKAAGAVVEMQPVKVPGGEYMNVIGRFGPAEGAITVIGAHYDACEAFPAADDNASGVAGLIELAVLYGQHPPPFPVELVAYTLEEPPYFASDYMGSAVHARSLQQAKREVSLMISLEMIGFFKDERGSQQYPAFIMKFFYPSRGNYIAIVGSNAQRKVVKRFKKAAKGVASIPYETLAAPASVPGVNFSDHRNYWALGYPALMITDTAFMRNPNYHKASDTADTLDYTRMAEVVRLVYGGLENYTRAQVKH